MLCIRIVSDGCLSLTPLWTLSTYLFQRENVISVKQARKRDVLELLWKRALCTTTIPESLTSRCTFHVSCSFQFRLAPVRRSSNSRRSNDHCRRIDCDLLGGPEQRRAADLPPASGSRTVATPRRVAHQQAFCSQTSAPQGPVLLFYTSSDYLCIQYPPCLHCAAFSSALSWSSGVLVCSAVTEPTIIGQSGLRTFARPSFKIHFVVYEPNGLHITTLSNDDRGIGGR